VNCVDPFLGTNETLSPKQIEKIEQKANENERIERSTNEPSPVLGNTTE